VLKLLPSAVEQAVVLDAAAGPNAQVAEIRAAAAAVASVAASYPGGRRHLPPLAAMRPVDCGAAGEPACNALEGFVNGVGKRFRSDLRGFYEHMRAHVLSAAPYAAFLLLPVFAGIVMLAYRSRRMTYGEHVVFSLHLHAFWFLALLLIELLPDPVSDVLVWVVPVYGVLAMHEVYRGGWGATLLRAAFASVVYGVVLVLASVALVLGLLALA